MNVITKYLIADNIEAITALLKDRIDNKLLIIPQNAIATELSGFSHKKL
jgi:hypothetical protein